MFVCAINQCQVEEEGNICLSQLSLATAAGAVWDSIQIGHSSKQYSEAIKVTDGQVVRAGVSATWIVLLWSEGHKFEPQSGRT